MQKIQVIILGYYAIILMIIFGLILQMHPLSPNSDQHQFSPNEIHTLS